MKKIFIFDSWIFHERKFVNTKKIDFMRSFHFPDLENKSPRWWWLVFEGDLCLMAYSEELRMSLRIVFMIDTLIAGDINSLCEWSIKRLYSSNRRKVHHHPSPKKIFQYRRKRGKFMVLSVKIHRMAMRWAGTHKIKLLNLPRNLPTPVLQFLAPFK